MKDDALAPPAAPHKPMDLSTNDNLNRSCIPQVQSPKSKPPPISSKPPPILSKPPPTLPRQALLIIPVVSTPAPVLSIVTEPFAPLTNKDLIEQTEAAIKIQTVWRNRSTDIKTPPEKSSLHATPIEMRTLPPPPLLKPKPPLKPPLPSPTLRSTPAPTSVPSTSSVEKDQLNKGVPGVKPPVKPRQVVNDQGPLPSAKSVPPLPLSSRPPRPAVQPPRLVIAPALIPAGVTEIIAPLTDQELIEQTQAAIKIQTVWRTKTTAKESLATSPPVPRRSVKQLMAIQTISAPPPPPPSQSKPALIQNLNEMPPRCEVLTPKPQSLAKAALFPSQDHVMPVESPMQPKLLTSSYSSTQPPQSPKPLNVPNPVAFQLQPPPQSLNPPLAPSNSIVFPLPTLSVMKPSRQAPPPPPPQLQSTKSPPLRPISAIVHEATAMVPPAPQPSPHITKPSRQESEEGISRPSLKRGQHVTGQRPGFETLLAEHAKYKVDQKESPNVKTDTHEKFTEQTNANHSALGEQHVIKNSVVTRPKSLRSSGERHSDGRSAHKTYSFSKSGTLSFDGEKSPVLEIHIESYEQKYKLDPEIIGRGGYGIVHRATRINDGLIVALKIIKRSETVYEDKDDDGKSIERIIKGYHGDPQAQGELRNEDLLLHHLKGQPGILELYDRYETAEQISFVTEFCHLGTLYDYLENKIHPEVTAETDSWELAQSRTRDSSLPAETWGNKWRDLYTKEIWKIFQEILEVIYIFLTHLFPSVIHAPILFS